MIEIKDIAITINNTNLLHDINLTLEQGKCYGFIGRNGSGKSLLFKTIVGLLPLQTGKILINNNSIEKQGILRNAGIIIESPNFINNMTGLENLKMLAQIQNIITSTDIENVLSLVGLDPTLTQKYKHYSLGMKQRLRIAQAIMENPQYYILDEPFNGLDEQGVQDIRQTILTLKEKNKMILLTSHDERDITFLCDTVFKIEGGTISEDKTVNL